MIFRMVSGRDFVSQGGASCMKGLLGVCERWWLVVKWWWVVWECRLMEPSESEVRGRRRATLGFGVDSFFFSGVGRNEI
jgi:hypothetical protein